MIYTILDIVNVFVYCETYIFKHTAHLGFCSSSGSIFFFIAAGLLIQGALSCSQRSFFFFVAHHLGTGIIARLQLGSLSFSSLEREALLLLEESTKGQEICKSTQKLS
jgi:hypothetical protein